MKVDSPDAGDSGRNWELCYCSNVHPGESWPEVRQVLLGPVHGVKTILRPSTPFGVGLRLSNRAIEDLQEPAAREDFRNILQDQGLYVRTINGFPYGAFHGTRVKEAVYQPDWTDLRRSTYTLALARLLADVLPPPSADRAEEESNFGSISTVPGAYLDRRDEASCQHIAQALLHTVAELWRIREQTGQRIILGLEPEPMCMIETTEQCIQFFQQYLTTKAALQHLQQLSGLHRSAAETVVHEHLGICLDVCHAAVEFEDCPQSLQRLQEAGITLAKIQLSAGLLVSPSDESLTRLEAFADDTYLHQVVAQLPNSELLRFSDLPRALASPQARAASEWRIHFHVPIFSDKVGPFQNTQAQLCDVLKHLDTLADEPKGAFRPHLEVETYSWNLIPPEYRGRSVVEDIVRELRWVEEHLS